MSKLDKELNITGYARNQAKSASRTISGLLSQIDLASSMVSDDLLEPEKYTNFVLNAKKEIKDSVSMIYSYLHLQDVEGHYDQAFVQSASQGDGKGE